MNLRDLIVAFRARADDLTEPPLWSDDEVTLYLNEAQNEAATRALLIRDSTTAAVCTIAITTVPTDYALHTSVLVVDRVKLASQTSPLARVTVDWLDENCADWEAGTAGTPRYFVEDAGRIRLVPKSSVSDTLALTVYRLPLEAMNAEDDVPEIHAREHHRMIDWALRCAYLKPDTDAFDKKRALDSEAMFEASFGLRPDANVQRKQREHRPTIVRMNW